VVKCQKVKSEYLDREVWEMLIPSMPYYTGLAVLVALDTGLRIGDIVGLRVENLVENGIQYTAQKTKKQGFAPCKPELLSALWKTSEAGWCFPPARLTCKTPHRTRQSIWYGVRKAAVRAGVKPHVSPHSARKTFSVGYFRTKGIKALQEALQHGDTNTTNLYAFSDVQGATYNRERLVSEVSDKVLQRLSEILGIDLTPLPPRPQITGENELK
jgi:integrase